MAFSHYSMHFLRAHLIYEVKIESRQNTSNLIGTLLRILFAIGDIATSSFMALQSLNSSHFKHPYFAIIT
jgi:hypothetical protein